MAFTVRVGRPKDIGFTAPRIEAATIKRIAEVAVERLQADIKHPAARTLSVKGINQHAAEISGTRGGPGTIIPVRKKALHWSGAAHPVSHVRGVGFEPKLSAEINRINVLDIDVFVP